METDLAGTGNTLVATRLNFHVCFTQGIYSNETFRRMAELEETP